MRAFDWRGFLTKNSVSFIEKGANVKRGEINIRCPFCGTADPSFHMGLNLETGWYSCWRNKSAHSGKSPLRLLMVLLGVPYWRARELAGLDRDYVDPEGFSAVAARLLGASRGLAEAMPKQRQRLSFPDGFGPIPPSAWAQRYRAYLYSRGFDYIPDLIEAYDLQCASFGEWRDRIIIPYFIDRELVSWAGRAIGPATLRYRELSPEDSLVPVKHTLFNYDCIAAGGKALIIQEGPIDALKVDFFGYGVGVRSVALSTNSLNEEQAFMIEEAVGQFDRIIVMMDNAGPISIVDGMRLKQQLGHIPGIETQLVPYGLKDCGEMSPKQALEWTNELSKSKA